MRTGEMTIAKEVVSLLNCPFCGEPLSTLHQSTGTKKWSVYCEVCFATTRDCDTNWEAVAMWNCRANYSMMCTERLHTVELAIDEILETLKGHHNADT